MAVEIHENWLEATRYLNMDHLREPKKEPEGIGRLRRGRHVRRSAKHGGCAADTPTSPLNATPFLQNLTHTTQACDALPASADSRATTGRIPRERVMASAPTAAEDFRMVLWLTVIAGFECLPKAPCSSPPLSYARSGARSATP
ncbi:hypothetical protein BQ8482_10018 [Mesorhizobium delmotii]|uniref:Uncharacterized protein n=1 Tax=Mesorhizobium delmotii TaxID=1631247 RepID=A0A2P9A9K7_9HYPH|nr:hypothetical protein BQ8482_10018 [Mesorhizobium delmotii]